MSSGGVYYNRKSEKFVEPIYKNAPFFGDIKDLNSLKSNFEIGDKELKDFEILFSIYIIDGYEGSAFVLLRNKITNALYEVNAGHRSCMGLEGQFEPEKTSAEFLKFLLNSNISKFTVGANLFYDSNQDEIDARNYFTLLVDKLLKYAGTHEIQTEG